MPLKPLSLPRSLLYFGIPAVVAQLLFWKGIRVIDFFGAPLFITYGIFLSAPAVAVFLCALLAYRREGNPRTLAAFRERMRLGNIDARLLAISAMLCALIIFLRMVSSEWMESIIAMPKIWVRMMEQDPNFFMDLPRGNWKIPAVYSVVILASCASEIWWRGIIFPRQELTYASRTWLIHSLLWFAFRSFLPMDIPWLLPSALGLSYITQRTRSTWPAIFAQIAMHVPI